LELAQVLTHFTAAEISVGKLYPALMVDVGQTMDPSAKIAGFKFKTKM
jgi:hypothetical protein